jgi:hypothetical protein
MYAWADCGFDHQGSSGGLVDFTTIDSQVGIAISSSETADRPANLIARHKEE